MRHRYKVGDMCEVLQNIADPKVVRYIGQQVVIMALGWNPAHKKSLLDVRFPHYTVESQDGVEFGATEIILKLIKGGDDFSSLNKIKELNRGVSA